MADPAAPARPRRARKPAIRKAAKKKPPEIRRAAVVTGASSGLGKDIATLFARDGHDVVLVARSEGRLREIAADLESACGIRATVVALDVARAEADSVLAEILATEAIEVEFLVNNAGFGLYGRFTETEWLREEEMIALNITALTRFTKAFLPGMVARGRGRIMNLASTAAFQPGPMMAVYYATKAYVLSFTEAVACEVAGTGVTLTAFCPGPTRTGFQEAANLGGSRVFDGRFMGDIMASEEVARLGYDALLRGEPVAVAGLRNQVLAQAAQILPRALVTRVSRWAIEVSNP